MKRSKTKSTAAAVVPCGRIVAGVDIDREWRVNGEIVPSTSECSRFRRSPYFYRKQALAWAKSAVRRTILTPAECKAWALHYLHLYKAAKATAGGTL